MKQEVLENSNFYEKLTRISTRVLELKPINPHLFLFECVSVMPEKLALEEEEPVDPDKLVSLRVFHLLQCMVFRPEHVQTKLAHEVFQELLLEGKERVDSIRMQFVLKIYFDVKKFVRYLDSDFEVFYAAIFDLRSTTEKTKSGKPKKLKSFNSGQFQKVFRRFLFFAEFFMALDETFGMKLDLDFLGFVGLLGEYLEEVSGNLGLVQAFRRLDFASEIEENYKISSVDKKSLFKLLCQKAVSLFGK